MKILLIDDNADAAVLMALILRHKGCEVCSATSGPEALGLAPVFKPDIACVDLAMPGIDGYELSRRLRQAAEMASIPIVVITGWPPDKARMDEAGVSRHFLRPVRAAELHAACCELVDSLPSGVE